MFLFFRKQECAKKLSSNKHHLYPEHAEEKTIFDILVVENVQHINPQQSAFSRTIYSQAFYIYY